MPRVLIACLSAHWATVFAFRAFEAGAGAMSSGMAPAAVTGVLYCLAGATFLWTGLAAWGREPSGEVAPVALLVSVLALGAGVAAAAITGQRPDIHATAMQLAALVATYLLIRFEEVQAAMLPQPEDGSGAFARRLAIGAAHGAMLSKLAARGPEARG
jgi:hypothetical protein